MKLPRWVAERRSWWPYLYWLAVLALCVTLLRQIWAGNWSLILTLALGLAVGLRVFKEMVESLAGNVVNRRFSPWHSAQRSIVFPRVWTLHITLYTVYGEVVFARRDHIAPFALSVECGLRIGAATSAEDRGVQQSNTSPPLACLNDGWTRRHYRRAI